MVFNDLDFFLKPEQEGFLPGDEFDGLIARVENQGFRKGSTSCLEGIPPVLSSIIPLFSDAFQGPDLHKCVNLSRLGCAFDLKPNLAFS